MKKPIRLPFNIGSVRAFPKDAIEMDFFKNEKDASIYGGVKFGKPMEGPPGHVHGGISAYVLDEAMGIAAWIAGYPSVATEINVKLFEMTPQGKELQIEASVVQVEDRNVKVRAKLFDKSKTYSESTGTFHRVQRNQLERFLQSTQESCDMSYLKFPKAD